MSEISSHPRVRKVSSTAAPITAALAGALLAAAARGLSAAARTAFEFYSRQRSAGPSEIGPVPEFPKISALPLTLTPAERVQVSALLSIAAAPCLVDEPRAIAPSIEALAKASSLLQANQARSRLFSALEASHQRVFLGAVSEACSKAAVRAGFTQVETRRGPLGELRVIASDAVGRSLVSEISADSQRDVRLETEVVGVTDGSCHDIMNRHAEALLAEGIRSGPPARRPTGGVCVLPASWEVACRQAEARARRLQRLNRPSTERSRT